MLHKLALVTTAEVPSLIKEALPTPEEHRRMLARDQQKAMDLAASRGIKVPMVEKTVLDPTTGKPTTTSVPDIANTRMNARAEPTVSTAEVKTKGGEARKVKHVTPGASVSPGHSALREKEVQKAYGTVSNSVPKQMKHTYVGGARRFLGGKGLFGNKWGNRGALGLGIGALGLGINAYLDSNKVNPQALGQPPMAETPQQYSGYPKTGSDKYSPDAVTVPKPTAQPTVKALGPGVSSVPKLTGTAASSKGLLGGGVGGSGSSSSGSGSSSPSSKQAEDSGVLPLLAAAGGGAGGWALGKKLLQPTLEQKKLDLAEEIAKKQAKLKTLSKATTSAPLGAAAAGALLLAALSALYAKRGKESKSQVTPVSAYDPTGAGFQQNGYNPYGNFYG